MKSPEMNGFSARDACTYGFFFILARFTSPARIPYDASIAFAGSSRYIEGVGHAFLTEEGGISVKFLESSAGVRPWGIQGDLRCQACLSVRLLQKGADSECHFRGILLAGPWRLRCQTSDR